MTLDELAKIFGDVEIQAQVITVAPHGSFNKLRVSLELTGAFTPGQVQRGTAAAVLKRLGSQQEDR